MLALAEAGAKKAQHLSTEKNIEASDLYNFYQAKKIRSTVVETASKMLEAQNHAASPIPRRRRRSRNRSRLSRRPSPTSTRIRRSPRTVSTRFRERATAATEARELANHKLEHYELGSGLTQIAIVLASAAIITGIAVLMWLSVGLGAIGAILLAFGFLRADRAGLHRVDRIPSPVHGRRWPEGPDEGFRPARRCPASLHAQPQRWIASP